MTHHKPQIVSSYLAPVFTPSGLRKCVRNLVKLLKPHVDKFDTIVFRGTSGALVGPAVALALDKPMLFIRKPSSDSHYSGICEGNVVTENYVIIDDFISSGNTLRAIKGAIADYRNGHNSIESNSHLPPAKCYGVACYLDQGWCSEETIGNVFLSNEVKFFNTKVKR